MNESPPSSHHPYPYSCTRPSSHTNTQSVHVDVTPTDRAIELHRRTCTHTYRTCWRSLLRCPQTRRTQVERWYHPRQSSPQASTEYSGTCSSRTARPCCDRAVSQRAKRFARQEQKRSVQAVTEKQALACPCGAADVTRRRSASRSASRRSASPLSATNLEGHWGPPCRRASQREPSRQGSRHRVARSRRARCPGRTCTSRWPSSRR